MTRLDEIQERWSEFFEKQLQDPNIRIALLIMAASNGDANAQAILETMRLNDRTKP